MQFRNTLYIHFNSASGRLVANTNFFLYLGFGSPRPSASASSNGGPRLNAAASDSQAEGLGCGAQASQSRERGEEQARRNVETAGSLEGVQEEGPVRRQTRPFRFWVSGLRRVGGLLSDGIRTEQVRAINRQNGWRLLPKPIR